MLFEKQIEEESDEAEDSRERRIEELKTFIKAQRHLHDDHGAAIIGSRDKSPIYPEE